MPNRVFHVVIRITFGFSSRSSGGHSNVTSVFSALWRDLGDPRYDSVCYFFYRTSGEVEYVRQVRGWLLAADQNLGEMQMDWSRLEGMYSREHLFVACRTRVSSVSYLGSIPGLVSPVSTTGWSRPVARRMFVLFK